MPAPDGFHGPRANARRTDLKLKQRAKAAWSALRQDDIVALRYGAKPVWPGRSSS